jgi:hypothetical protein
MHAFVGSHCTFQKYVAAAWVTVHPAGAAGVACMPASAAALCVHAGP